MIYIKLKASNYAHTHQNGARFVAVYSQQLKELKQLEKSSMLTVFKAYLIRAHDYDYKGAKGYVSIWALPRSHSPRLFKMAYDLYRGRGIKSEKAKRDITLSKQTAINEKKAARFKRVSKSTPHELETRITQLTAQNRILKGSNDKREKKEQQNKIDALTRQKRLTARVLLESARVNRLV
jgi:hypothetical protein